MKAIIRVLALSFLGLILSPMAHSQVIGNISCQSAGGSTLKGPLFAFLLDVDTQDAIDLYDITVYVDVSLLGPLLAAQAAQTTYATCTLSNGATLSVANAVITDVEGALAGAGIQSASSQMYATATFFFTSVTVGGVTVATKDPSTPEARAAAIAIVKAKSLASVIPRTVAVQ